jgi:hypothetical protein
MVITLSTTSSNYTLDGMAPELMIVSVKPVHPVGFCIEQHSMRAIGNRIGSMRQAA